MGNLPLLPLPAQVAKPGIAAVSKTAGRKAAQVQILPWALPRSQAWGPGFVVPNESFKHVAVDHGLGVE